MPTRASRRKAAEEPGGPELLEEQVSRVRRFNRFHTRQIGVLQESLLDSRFSLTEGRVLYEIAQKEDTTATALGRELGIDPGYLSRILRGFEGDRLVERRPSPADARQSLLRLTRTGRDAFAELDQRSHDEIAAQLGKLTPADRRRLVDAMDTVERVLGADPPEPVPYLLRTHQPGDMGWVVQRHGLLYAQEYGWDERFEGLVARVVADFIDGFDPKRERCWIAERDGENVGSVFLVQKSRTVAQLRLLLVEPSARRLGIGRRLVGECSRFARQAGYRRITLWTNDVLRSARRVYEAEGYRFVGEDRHSSFGPELVGQTWELEL
jgi:DNA-binding MarR family transcriptional regulator/GNAT superfamily N-acetyltransferase